MDVNKFFSSFGFYLDVMFFPMFVWGIASDKVWMTVPEIIIVLISIPAWVMEIARNYF
jgi:hypothetical protein